MLAYLDASALVKLLVAEPESDALGAFLAGHSLVTSRIALVEVRRAVGRALNRSIELRGGILDEIAIVECDAEIAERAASLQPVTLRTLDAIHAATALALMPDLGAFVVYDERLAAAATGLKLPVVTPRG